MPTQTRLHSVEVTRLSRIGLCDSQVLCFLVDSRVTISTDSGDRSKTRHLSHHFVVR